MATAFDRFDFNEDGWRAQVGTPCAFAKLCLYLSQVTYLPIYIATYLSIHLSTYVLVYQSIYQSSYLPMRAPPHTHILNNYSTYICYTYICYIYIYTLYIWLVVSMFLFFNRTWDDWLKQHQPVAKVSCPLTSFLPWLGWFHRDETWWDGSHVENMLALKKRYRKVGICHDLPSNIGILPWFTIKHGDFTRENRWT